jgi:hypothetical protein
LITAAPLAAIVHIQPADGQGTNQLRRASDEGDRMQVLEDLGVHPIEAFQSDALVVVEGTTDAPRLSALLPLEFGRVFTFVAGSASDVESVTKMLNDEASPFPHIGVRDRDLLTDAQVAALETAIPNLFVWSRRSVENELLFPPLITRTLERIGRRTSEADVLTHLRDLADQQHDVVHSELVAARLRERHAFTRSGDTPLERQRHYLEEVRRVADEKLAQLETVAAEVDEDLEERWATDFMVLADGKRNAQRVRAVHRVSRPS